VSAPRTVNGIVFSDLGLASKFMALQWVREALSECLGFAPYPATLNVHPANPEDSLAWQSIRKDTNLFSHMPRHEGSCLARIYRIEVRGRASDSRGLAAAVLLPEVKDYPEDKIEIVAPVRLKDAFGVRDGDQLTLEFIH
jgi:CTP-dependent riboflavin kinase